MHLDKSSFLARNTSPERQQEISQLSCFPASNKYEKYLGLSTLVGKSRSQAFKSINDKVWNRLHHWKVKFLSEVRKEILGPNHSNVQYEPFPTSNWPL